MGGRARVIGLGEPAAADDGAGIAVVERLATLGIGAHVELTTTRDVTQLVELLTDADPVILVEALADGGPPGRVVRVTPEALDSPARPALSSHGLDVARAIALTRALHPTTIARHIEIVAITIAPPRALHYGLSPDVAAAVPVAAARVVALLSPTNA